MRNIKFLQLSLIASALLLGACNSDDDKEEKMEPVVNLAPTAQSSMVTTQTETSVTGMLQASDPEGDALTFRLVTEPTAGVVVVASDGSYTYTPGVEFTGEDSFEYAVNDVTNAEQTATVTITIEALEVEFANQARTAFAQQSSDEPMRVNGRVFLNTKVETDFSDLVDGQ